MKRNIIFLSVCVAAIAATAIIAASFSSWLLGLVAGIAITLAVTVPIGRLVIRRQESAQVRAIKDLTEM